MRRPQSASGLVAVFAGLLVVTMTASPAHALSVPPGPAPARAFDAPGACTPWKSQFLPPPTIRVRRSERSETPGAVADTVQEVDFREYVATVMAAEWPEHYPLESLKAGAVATKQFAWYHIINPRGGAIELEDGSRACYDVVDTTVDQVYYPERHAPGPKIAKAIDATWDVTVRKYRKATTSSSFFLTGYRAGSTSVCGADATGWKLFHRSVRACGQDRLKFREILRLYLKPRLEIVTVGRHDIIGTRHGDAAAMSLNGASELEAHVWTPGKAPPEPGSHAGATLATAGLVGYQSSDVDGDGDDDLVWMRQTGDRSGRLKVALSDGVDYREGQVWYDGETLAPLRGARLLVGDFNANGRRDVALLARGEQEGKGQLVVFRKKPGDGFTKASLWWTGDLELGKVRDAWAGDVSGDGRADLVVRQDLPDGGLRIKSAVTKSPLPSGDQRLGALATRFESTSLVGGKTRMVMADANRDGREDLLMVVGGGGRTRIERLQGQALGGFKRVRIWRAPKSDPIRVRKSRLGAADVDYDGRTDLVIFSEAGDGSRLRVLKTRYQSMKKGPDRRERGIPWSGLRPY